MTSSNNLDRIIEQANNSNGYDGKEILSLQNVAIPNDSANFITLNAINKLTINKFLVELTFRIVFTVELVRFFP